MIGPWVNIFQLNLKLTKKFIMLFPSGSEPKFEMTGRFVKKPRYFDKNYWPPPEMVHFEIHIELKTEKSLTVCFNCPFKNLTFLNFFFEFSSSEIFFIQKHWFQLQANHVNYCTIYYFPFFVSLCIRPPFISQGETCQSPWPCIMHSYAIIWLSLLDNALN